VLKLLVKFVLCVAIACFIAYIVIDVFLEPLSYRVINYAIEHLQNSRAEVSEASFQNVTISSFNAVSWKGFHIIATLATNPASQKKRRADIRIETLTIESEKLFEGLFTIHATGLSISYLDPATSSPVGANYAPKALQEGSLTAPLRVNVTDPSRAVSQLRDFASAMIQLEETGKTTIPLRLSGKQIIKLKDNSYVVNIGVEREGDGYHFVANKDNLKSISDNLFSEASASTPADIEIIAHNPLRALRLLGIRLRAETTASNAHKQDPRVPEDAYRHVLWSYLLAKEYGADFAKNVTDAHELTNDPEEKNNPRAGLYHKQDYNNNEVGRYYAERDYAESSIMGRANTDPKVIRDSELR
jgi:hypothetical protein